MSDIGVRELKIHASEIVRKVKERGERYIITHRGRPVAAIIPVEEAQGGLSSPAGVSVWDELVELGQQISQGWQSPKTSVEILSDMRR
jgi:prevent-host-death family protein